MSIKNILLDVLRGAVMGVANIIPGVSGGTMAVSMGIYDRIIRDANEVFKKFKKSILDLLPILAGILIGLFAFAAVIGKLLGTDMDTIPLTRLPTNFAFIGLILGGLPAIFRSVDMKKAGAKGVLLFVVFFIIVAGLPLLTKPEAKEVGHSIGMALLMIPLGAIASATMVIPGVSGSMILMLLGYYQAVINSMNELRSGDFSALVILLPYLVGLLIGIVSIAKLMNFLLKKYPAYTFCAIFGLVIGSPVPLLLQNRDCFSLVTPGNAVACVLCLAAGFLIAWLMSRLDAKTAKDGKME